MALVFAWRPDDANYYARYSKYGKQGRIFQLGVTARSVDAGAIGGYSIDYSTTSANPRKVTFNGQNIDYNSSGISILYRVKPNYTGGPIATKGLLEVSWGTGIGSSPIFSVVHQITTGNLLAFARNSAGTTILNNVSAGAWSPTSGTWYDIIITWDYTAGNFKVYIDGALLGTVSPTAAFITSGTATTDDFKLLSFGGNSSASPATAYIGEGVVWNSVIDPTANVNLESGAGLLNGASRTSFVSDVAGSILTSYDGLASTGGVMQNNMGNRSLG